MKNNLNTFCNSEDGFFAAFSTEIGMFVVTFVCVCFIFIISFESDKWTGIQIGSIRSIQQEMAVMLSQVAQFCGAQKATVEVNMCTSLFH